MYGEARDNSLQKLELRQNTCNKEKLETFESWETHEGNCRAVRAYFEFNHTGKLTIGKWNALEIGLSVKD